MRILIKGGHVVDPANKIDELRDVLIQDGRIVKVQKNIKEAVDEIINASGKHVFPGLVDVHTHLRQPGQEGKETIESGSRAAAKGGFTSVCCMPNTKPVIDERSLVQMIYAEAERVGLIKVFPFGAVTKNLEGKLLSEIGELKDAGVVALSDDGRPVYSSKVMRHALEYAKMFDLRISDHCQDLDLSEGAVMHEGVVSTELGLKGMPAASETVMVARDIELAEMTGGKLHIAHASCAGSIWQVREAKARGVDVTCEVCPHHFSLSHEAVRNYDPCTKMYPPLRTQEDIIAIKEGLADGTVDCIATDHAPHTQWEKEMEYNVAPCGIIGLETAFSLSLKELVHTKILTLSQLIDKMSSAPAKIFALPAGSLSEGVDADVALVDLESEWTVKEEEIHSKSKNTPFMGMTLPGVIEMTLCRGKIVYRK
ncbi:MAG: dihydroorotase [Candidatus Omnitrophica bacterium]|nr:dihydroorotase [Candidatus Omnitrophota bacterium]